MICRVLVILFALSALMGCGSSPSPTHREIMIRQKGPLGKARTLFHRVAHGTDKQAVTAFNELFALCKKGEPDFDYYQPGNTGKDGEIYAAIAYFAFYPVLTGDEKYLQQSRSGTRTLNRAVPRIIAMMLDKKIKEADADYLLRQIQGRSPKGHDKQSWVMWWEDHSKEIFCLPTKAAGMPVKLVE